MKLRDDEISFINSSPTEDSLRGSPQLVITCSLVSVKQAKKDLKVAIAKWCRQYIRRSVVVGGGIDLRYLLTSLPTNQQCNASYLHFPFWYWVRLWPRPLFAAPILHEPSVIGWAVTRSVQLWCSQSATYLATPTTGARDCTLAPTATEFHPLPPLPPSWVPTVRFHDCLPILALHFNVFFLSPTRFV